MTTRTQSTAKELFRVTYNRPEEKFDQKLGRWVRVGHTKETAVVEKDCIKWYQDVVSVEELGAQWPEGVEVSCTSFSRPFRCCTEAYYKVVSPQKLTDQDFDILRAQGCFMSGQTWGAVKGDPVMENGKYVYTCYSFCDSGD